MTHRPASDNIPVEVKAPAAQPLTGDQSDGQHSPRWTQSSEQTFPHKNVSAVKNQQDETRMSREKMNDKINCEYRPNPQSATPHSLTNSQPSAFLVSKFFIPVLSKPNLPLPILIPTCKALPSNTTPIRATLLVPTPIESIPIDSATATIAPMQETMNFHIPTQATTTPTTLMHHTSASAKPNPVNLMPTTPNKIFLIGPVFVKTYCLHDFAIGPFYIRAIPIFDVTNNKILKFSIQNQIISQQDYFRDYRPNALQHCPIELSQIIILKSGFFNYEEKHNNLQVIQHFPFEMYVYFQEQVRRVPLRIHRQEFLLFLDKLTKINKRIRINKEGIQETEIELFLVENVSAKLIPIRNDLFNPIRKKLSDKDHNLNEVTEQDKIHKNQAEIDQIQSNATELDHVKKDPTKSFEVRKVPFELQRFGKNPTNSYEIRKYSIKMDKKQNTPLFIVDPRNRQITKHKFNTLLKIQTDSGHISAIQSDQVPSKMNKCNQVQSPQEMFLTIKPIAETVDSQDMSLLTKSSVKSTTNSSHIKISHEKALSSTEASTGLRNNSNGAQGAHSPLSPNSQYSNNSIQIQTSSSPALFSASNSSPSTENEKDSSQLVKCSPKPNNKSSQVQSINANIRNQTSSSSSIETNLASTSSSCLTTADTQTKTELTINYRVLNGRYVYRNGRGIVPNYGKVMVEKVTKRKINGKWVKTDIIRLEEKIETAKRAREQTPENFEKIEELTKQLIKAREIYTVKKIISASKKSYEEKRASKHFLSPSPKNHSKTTKESTKRVNKLRKSTRLSAKTNKESTKSINLHNKTEKEPIKATKAPTEDETETSLPTHDPCCFECHRLMTQSALTTQHCSLCPLSYHRKCVRDSRLFQIAEKTITLYDAVKDNLNIHDDNIESLRTLTNVCDQCVLKMVGSVFNRTDFGFAHSNSFESDVYQTYKILINVLIEIKALKPFVKIKIPDSKKHLICQEMDLSIMRDKVKRGLYNSLDDVVHDIDMIIHNQCILTRNNLNCQYTCRLLKEQVNEEIEFIRKCDSCYRLYYIITEPKDMPDTDFYLEDKPTQRHTASALFNHPCQTPHVVVWVLLDRKWWPAKVFHHCRPGQFMADTDRVAIQTFGFLHKKVVPWSDCYTFSEVRQTVGVSALTDDQQRAIREADHYLDLLDQYSFHYKKPAFPRQMKPNDDLYINETEESKDKIIPTANHYDQRGEMLVWRCYRRNCTNIANDVCGTIMRSYCCMECKRIDLHFKR